MTPLNIDRKLSLCLLFAFSLILVAITLYRMIEVVHRQYEQQFRSLLASVEILAAAAVANALVLGSFMRDRGAKKQRYRPHPGSLSGHSSQDVRPAVRRNITAQNWGSDADLAEELGISCAADLHEKEAETSRPAPMAIPLEKDAKNLTPGPRHLDLASGRNNESTAEKGQGTSLQVPQSMAMPNSPSKAAFFDIGGLLSNDDIVEQSRQHSVTSSTMQNFSRPMSSQGAATGPSRPGYTRSTGSDAFLEDVGGLLGSASYQSSKDKQVKPHQRQISLVDVLRETGPDAAAQPVRTSANASSNVPDIQDAGGLLG